MAYEQRKLAATLEVDYAELIFTLRLTAKLKPEFGGKAVAGDDVVMIKDISAQ